MMERRNDRLTALYVDAILNFCQPDFQQSAIVALLDHGLSLDAVLRILNRPSERRQYDQFASTAAATAA
jgi:hypothetical protein